MRTRPKLAALGLAALALCACNKAPSDVPVPTVKPPLTESGSAQAVPPSTSVPPADSVFAPDTSTPPAQATGRSNSTMSRTQESTAMPMPGQTNDHSAPLTPAKPASSP